MMTALCFICALILTVAGLITACIGGIRNNNKVTNTGYAMAIIGFIAIVAILATVTTSTWTEALSLTLGFLFIGCPTLVLVFYGYLKLEESIKQRRNRC